MIAIADFQALKKNKGRLLGFDVGKKTLGLALSDSNWTIATPGITLKREKISPMVLGVHTFINGEPIAGVVVGLPKNLDGGMNPMAKSVLDFISAFKSVFPYPYLFWDERFTTNAAERALKEANLNYKKRNEKIDALAASFILQSFLDYCLYQETSAFSND